MEIRVAKNGFDDGNVDVVSHEGCIPYLTKRPRHIYDTLDQQNRKIGKTFTLSHQTTTILHLPSCGEIITNIHMITPVILDVE